MDVASAPDDEALGQELGLEFNNFSPTERSMLLSARVARISGYDGGPEDDGSATSEGSTDDEGVGIAMQSRLTNTDWYVLRVLAVV